MTLDRRNGAYRDVTRALARRASVSGAEVVRVVSEPLGLKLATMLDARAVPLIDVPGYAIAEHIVARIEALDPGARILLVVLAGNEWSTRILSAAGCRMWPQVFEPLRGLSCASRPDFIRRAQAQASKGKPVCGIAPVAVT